MRIFSKSNYNYRKNSVAEQFAKVIIIYSRMALKFWGISKQNKRLNPNRVRVRKVEWKNHFRHWIRKKTPSKKFHLHHWNKKYPLEIFTFFPGPKKYIHIKKVHIRYWNKKYRTKRIHLHHWTQKNPLYDWTKIY